MRETFVKFDQNALREVQKWRLKYLNLIFIILTYSGKGRVWFSLVLFLFVIDKKGIQFTTKQQLFLYAFYAPLLAFIFGKIIKKIFSRERPSDRIVGFKPLIIPPRCGSFPSSHTAASTSFFITLLILNHPLTLFVGIWAFLISFSRIYLGVHYLSDVIGGLLLGFLCGVFVSSFHGFYQVLSF